jgi:para-nitrobenzyl esterase
LGEGNRLPVMVWLHGGGFAAGSGGSKIYDGGNLASRQNVVVVTINHRLNLLGHLYLAELGSDKYADSGNVGMLDIVASLEWVRDNIAAFGGDPGNVTIFGESGGGMKVTTLMAMPSAKGLFHKAIIQSGPFLQAVDPGFATQFAEMIIAKLGLKPGEVNDLQKIPAEQILAAMPPGMPHGLAPVVDGRSLPHHPFDPGAPELSADVPMLIGSNETEYTLLEPAPDALDDAALLARVKAVLTLEDSAAGRLITAYQRAHPDNVDAYLAITSDFFMGVNTVIQAERKAAQGTAPVYLYQFSWKTPALGGKLRSTHALEIPFAFDVVDSAKAFTGTGEERQALANRMSAAWAAFARAGNPNHGGLPNWPAYDSSQRAAMIFDNQCRVVNDPNGAERRAYRELGALTMSLA